VITPAPKEPGFLLLELKEYTRNMDNKEENTLSQEALEVPEDIDEVLDDSEGKFLGQDIVEQELPDYDSDTQFEGDENADN
jgi:hypothetical protein